MDELISRKAAIDLFPDDDLEWDTNGGYIAPHVARRMICELPSAQPETHEKRTETHAYDCISRQAVLDALQKHFNPTGAELSPDLASVLAGVGVVINTMPSAQLEKRTQKRTETHSCDCISRKEAIDAHYEYCNKHPDAGFPVWSLKILEDLPPAQPEQTNSWCINSWCNDCKEYDTESKCCPRYNRVIKQTLDEVYAHAETEAEARFHAQQRWIPCSERLPEEDVEVLISYRYKEGEGDTSHTYIDITTYGQMYFGGNKVGDHKHWRVPFEYFESNYEVIAWMPLPEPYKEGES